MVGVFASWRTQRWITLAFGCVLMLCAGTVYLLPAWSDGLRAQAHLSISSFNTVATGLNAGTWLGVIGGVLYDHVGPKPTGIAAGLLLFLGYFGIKLAVQHYAKTWLITVLALVVGQGSGFFYTVALNTSVKNFGPNSRGKVVGLLVCFFGLCSGIFTVFLKGFFPSANSGHLPQFLLFLALVTSCTGLIATFFQRLLFVADKTSLPPSMHPLTPADATPPPAEPLRITIAESENKIEEADCISCRLTLSLMFRASRFRSGGTPFIYLKFSVCNTFGRLFSGHISDTFARRLPRPAFLVMAALLMAIVQVIFAFASVNLLYLGAVLLGLAYGSFFCLVPTLTAEAFGVVHFGANYGLQGLAPAAGSELLSTLMAGGMADDRQRHHFVNVTSDHGHDHALHCLGPACYRVSLLVNAGLCVFAALIAVVITIRQRTGRADTLLKHSHSAIKQS
ncbi:hypothetical protein PTSG_01975 [Salpingoeca rosetta]|uniref:Nodulin-like domain-containing protein n=1 Tax=Salpingoeca rosetta (strain ATCC 50818 / BSB-021) TaxID=946362 RepID=F2TZI0_SALR5|nr:uncharacterized protein PTSG_01975 [Salpingoeca rosetta]EGD79004.1 hypothetical protein PTSG_01975 [Salpingoeca rosetta]|eukprot:XP_004997960.1 hypothetical protein PTSG_01975 [Salpingoeca rosetta]